MTDWPHSPLHRLTESGAYMITCGTYLKKHHLNSRLRLDYFQDLLFHTAEEFGWELQAWAILSNHYHLIALSPDDPEKLRTFISKLHTLSAREFNRQDANSGRKVWYQYYESRITWQKSYYPRLKYVHYNPVHHGLVQNAENYPWCSAAWFSRQTHSAFRKTVMSFKTDQIHVPDDFEGAVFPAE